MIKDQEKYENTSFRILKKDKEWLKINFGRVSDGVRQLIAVARKTQEKYLDHTKEGQTKPTLKPNR